MIIFVWMRALFLYLTILLFFCCRANAHAANRECRKVKEHHPSFVPLVKVIPCEQSGWHNGNGYFPEKVIESNINFKTDNPNSAGTFSNYFLPRLTVAMQQSLNRRLLQDLHTIVNYLIFPQHYFW